MLKTYGIFYNKASGNREGAEIAKKISFLLNKNNIQSIKITGKDVNDAIKSIKKAFEKINMLVVIGGDGTINVAMTALIQVNKDLPIAIIPAGTVNNFAKRYNIPLSIDNAIKIITDKHHIRRVGIAICNQNKAIISSLTFGNLADISNEVRQDEKHKFGKIVYLFKAIKHIGKNKSFKIRFTLNDQNFDQVLKTWFALITTTKSVAGHVYDEASPQYLHISLLHNIGLRQVLPYLFFAITGNLKDSKSITQFKTKSVIIKAEDNNIVQTRIDGDKSVKLPIKIIYKPKRIQILIK